MTTHRPAKILSTHTPELFEQAVNQAVALLGEGQAVALPTETVYGLAANALDAQAVGQLFQIKGRPPDNPIIVHVVGHEMAQNCALYWPDVATRLGAAFWPGPLTLVVPRSPSLPDLVTAGGTTVGIRWPSHPFIQAVIQACGFPLAAPSANLSTQISPTSPEHVQKALGDRLPLIVDGGPCQVGIESTVVDVTETPPRILRPGMISPVSLEAVIGSVTGLGPEATGRKRSPGLMGRHYAPQAKLDLWSWRDDQDLANQLAVCGVDPSRIQLIAHSRIPSGSVCGRVSVIPHDPEAFARAIYSELHACDQAGADFIVIEALPDSEAWLAIADRLRRAACR